MDCFVINLKKRFTLSTRDIIPHPYKYNYPSPIINKDPYSLGPNDMISIGPRPLIKYAHFPYTVIE